MNRLIMAALAALALGGCYPEGEYVVASSGGGSVAAAPPPLQYEVALNCGADVWVPGSWDWNGGWAWQAGRCMPYQTGFVYNQPYYAGGVYYRGYWGRPAPYYRGGYYGGG